jgi:hypothetical protein
VRLFQLVARGQMACFNGERSFHSQQVFKTREQAESRQQEFLNKCCGDGLLDLDPQQTTVKVVELELADEDEV